MIAEADIATLHPICPGAKLVLENTQQFVYLPSLQIMVGETVRTLDALLSPTAHSGYATRLFLSEQISERPTIGANPANWSRHQILSRDWYTWSWRDVSADLPLVQMLLAHVKALK